MTSTPIHPAADPAAARRFLLAAICAEVAATLCLKAALDFPLLYVVVLAGYVAAFFCLSRTLAHGMGVGTAYGIWGATGVVLTAALSHVLFQEPLTPRMAAGMGLIVMGVLCIDRSEE